MGVPVVDDEPSVVDDEPSVVDEVLVVVDEVLVEVPPEAVVVEVDVLSTTNQGSNASLGAQLGKSFARQILKK